MVSTPPSSPADAADSSAPVAATPRRSMGTWRNLLLSMAALGAVVALWLALVPRVERVEQPAVDIGATTRQLVRDTGTPLQQPAPSADWKCTSVRVQEPVPGLRVLQAGYHRQPDAQQYVAVMQTLRPTTIAAVQAWLGAEFRVEAGTLESGGTKWTRGSTLNPARRVLIGPITGNPVVVLVGTGSHDDLARFAAELRPVGTP